jgi:hypothetical protein
VSRSKSKIEGILVPHYLDVHQRSGCSWCDMIRCNIEREIDVSWRSRIQENERESKMKTKVDGTTFLLFYCFTNKPYIPKKDRYNECGAYTQKRHKGTKVAV